MSVMFDYGEVYWWGSIWQLIVMTALLINIWRTRNCSGLSLRSQILYALVFMSRHLDLTEPNNPPEVIVIKIVYFIVTVGTVFSMIHFSQTYDKQNDISRINFAIVYCIATSLIFNIFESFDYPQVMTTFSIFLEGLAIIPQCHLVYKTKRMDKKVFFYIVGMAVYSLLQVENLYCHRDRRYGTNIWIGAATVQFLYYCLFVYKIWPLLMAQSGVVQCVSSKNGFINKIYSVPYSQLSKDVVDNVEHNLESEAPRTSYFASNIINNVVLTPSTLIDMHNDKKHLMAEEPIEKY